ncbi:MAG: hypothetical protein ABL858_05495 [Candidatus Nitrotoga sp.]
MLFPDSPETALTFFVTNLVGSELKDLEGDEEITLPMRFVRALAFGAGVNGLAELENQRARAGTTAGLVLVLVFVMAAGKYDRPSLNKAVHIIEEIATRKKKQNVQFGHYSDRKEILKAWKLMKNCAHFWAALEWIYGPYGSNVLTRVPRGEEAIREFLRIACSFRQFGCDFHESHSKEKKSLLDSDSSLRLPDEFESEAYAVSEEPVPQWILDILYEYRAPKAL